MKTGDHIYMKEYGQGVIAKQAKINVMGVDRLQNATSVKGEFPIVNFVIVFEVHFASGAQLTFTKDTLEQEASVIASPIRSHC